MKNLKIVRTIDLWTEQHENHNECFNGAFVDGFENNKIAFDEYKIIKNCNCIISVSNPSINIGNKHNVIVFYKDKNPVRLMVINKNTDIDKCIHIALKQYFNNGNYGSDKYEFIPDLCINYKLTTDKEIFKIEHRCAFINDIKTRLIPIQENSLLTNNNI